MPGVKIISSTLFFCRLGTAFKRKQIIPQQLLVLQWKVHFWVIVLFHQRGKTGTVVTGSPPRPLPRTPGPFPARRNEPPRSRSRPGPSPSGALPRAAGYPAAALGAVVAAAWGDVLRRVRGGRAPGVLAPKRPAGLSKANMFHLMQRCCFRTPFRLQKITGPRLLLHGKNKTTCRSPSLCLQRDVCLLSRCPSLNRASVYAVKLRAFHTSLPLLKKKPPQESETKDLGLFRQSMKSLKDSPKPALYLSLAGLIPFVSVPLSMVVQGTYYPELAFAQVTYGAVILSFLGGMRWGFAVPENSPAKPDWMNLANSMVPPLIAWQALLFKDITDGAIMLVMGLGIALHYDLSLLPTYPIWFKGLRIVATVVAALSLLATVAMKAYSEKNLIISRNK